MIETTNITFLKNTIIGQLLPTENYKRFAQSFVKDGEANGYANQLADLANARYRCE